MADLGRDVSAWQTAVQRFDELAAERMDLHVTDLQILGFLATEGGWPSWQGCRRGSDDGGGPAREGRLHRATPDVRRVKRTPDTAPLVTWRNRLHIRAIPAPPGREQRVASGEEASLNDE